MHDERKEWDERYRSRSHASLEADPFFLDAHKNFVMPLFPARGRALDVAGGVGRHSLVLAQDGWQVTMIDISEVGSKQAGENARNQGLNLDVVNKDLSEQDAIFGQFELIVVFFYLERSLFPQLLHALRPGGLLLYKTYTEQSSQNAGRRPSHPMHLLQPNELLTAFSPLQVLHYDEVPGRGTAELIARNPGH